MRNQTPFHRLVGLLVLGLLVTVPVFAGAPEAFTERSTTFFDKAAQADHELFLHRFLTAYRVDQAAGDAIVVNLTDDQLDALRNGEVERRILVGAVADVGVDVRFQGFAKRLSNRAKPAAHGALRGQKDGFVWTALVQTPGSSAIRLHFADVSLPAGVELYVYNGNGQAFGPYTGAGPLGSGDFWANTLFGSDAWVQIHYRGDRRGAALAATRFSIVEAAHIGERFLLGVMGQAQQDGFTKAFCSFNASCVYNASCSSIPSAIQPAQDAVAQILFVSGAYYYICSGGLLADTDPGSQRPIFLTAHHCISKGREASSVEAFFQFTTPCGGACYDPSGVVPSTLGSSILASNRTSDYTLLELSEPAPAGSAFMGWNSTPIANTNGAGLFRISHPAGAPQAYSTHDVDTSKGTCSSWPRGNWIYSTDTYGATEGGSSGSPVLNANGQVVGQLSGGCGTNVNDNCDSVNNATVDGALAAYFPDVASILDPGTSCIDNDGDGSCAGTDCDDNDPNNYPGNTEVCDGQDNDCDGMVDEGCGSCLPSGSACSVDGDCCSNKCKGPSGGKSCKG